MSSKEKGVEGRDRAQENFQFNPFYFPDSSPEKIMIWNNIFFTPAVEEEHVNLSEE